LASVLLLRSTAPSPILGLRPSRRDLRFVSCVRFVRRSCAALFGHFGPGRFWAILRGDRNDHPAWEPGGAPRPFGGKSAQAFTLCLALPPPFPEVLALDAVLAEPPRSEDGFANIALQPPRAKQCWQILSSFLGGLAWT